MVLNSCKGGAKDKLLNDARATLVAQRVPVTETAITQRASFVTAMTGGKTGAEKDAAASEEIDVLWREIKAATLRAVRAKTKKGAA